MGRQLLNLDEAAVPAIRSNLFASLLFYHSNDFRGKKDFHYYPAAIQLINSVQLFSIITVINIVQQGWAMPNICVFYFSTNRIGLCPIFIVSFSQL